MKNEEKELKIEKIGQEHLYNLLTSKEVSWQAIIYELINTEQLDPWDIDLALLSNKYLEKMRELEEANFFISSKVLLAASLLLRIKSEILLNEYIRSIDEILFGKKEEKKYEYERIEIDENELPVLYPKTPIPRYKKVTLQELMTALDKAVNTENRRIRKEISVRIAEKDAEIVFPRTRVNVRDRIRKIYSRVLTLFKERKGKISYSEIAGSSKEEKVASFLPILHLDSQQKVFLEQEKHFDEIWVWLYEHYNKQVENVREEIEKKREEIAEKAGFDNPLANFFDMPS